MTEEERKAKLQDIREHVNFLRREGITLGFVDELQFLLSEICRLEIIIEEMEMLNEGYGYIANNKGGKELK